MRSKSCVFFAVVFCIVALSAGVLAEELAINVARVDTAPVIDGVLDDAIWSTIKEKGWMIDNFVEMGSLEPTSETIQAYMAYDDEAIYVAAKIYKGRFPIKAMVKKDSIDVWQDDHFEVFFNPYYPEDLKELQIMINPIGTRYLNAIEAEWSSNASKAVQYGAAQKSDHWSVELRIPFSAMQVDAPGSGDLWSGNIAGYKPVGVEVWWTYARIQESFHQPKLFVEVVFE